MSLGIPDPRPTVESLTESVRAVIVQLERLAGLRGEELARAATMQDLLNLQLVEAERDTNFNVTSLRASDSLTAATSGANTPWSIAELFIFKRAASTPSTPTGGSFDFASHVLTPPAGWSVSVPTGSDPVWISVSTAAVQGANGVDSTFTWSTPTRGFSDGQAVDMVFKRSATQPTTPGNSAGVPSGWYTDVASVPASTDPLWSAVGTRATPDDNWVWQTPIRVEGQDGTSVTILGELATTGDLPASGNTVGDGYIIGGDLYVWDGSTWNNVGSVQGPAGTDGVSVAELVVYIRSASAPSTPTGGSFNFSTGVLTAPASWSASIPSGTDPVYASLAVAVSTTPGGTVSLTGLWTSPVLTFQNGADGKAVDAVFQRSASQPSTPSPSSGTPSGWYSAVGNVPANSNPLWMSVGTRTSPTGNWTWQTPVQIEGTTGADGADGALAWAGADFQMGGFGDVILTKNLSGDAGEIGIQLSTLYFRDGQVYQPSSGSQFNTTVNTPYESTTRTANVFYVFASRTTQSLGRFGAGFNANNFFVAEYDAGANLWYAIGDGGQTVQFTPATSDAVIGIGSRPSTSDVGIRTLASFVAHLKFNATTALAFFENAAITNALIGSLVADKIAAGNLVVAMNLTTGSIQISQTGAVYSGKSAYGAATNGYFLGMSGGQPVIDIGDGTRYLRFHPSTGLQIGGDIVATGNIQSNAITIPEVTSGSDTFCSVGVETDIVITNTMTVSGGGVHVNVYGVVDSGSSTDLGLRISLYLDTGSGWVLRKTVEAGIRTSGGDTYFKMPIAIMDTLSGITTARARVTGIPFIMNNASVARAATLRNPVVVMLGVKR